MSTEIPNPHPASNVAEIEQAAKVQGQETWSTPSYYGPALEAAPIVDTTIEGKVIPTRVINALGENVFAGFKTGTKKVDGSTFTQVENAETGNTSYAKPEDLRAAELASKQAFLDEYPELRLPVKAAVAKVAEVNLPPSTMLEDSNVQKGLPADFHYTKPRAQVVQNAQGTQRPNSHL